MKNSKYFPFERNKYFYGKLLSVDDFNLEQRYGNNKRRMSNRFLAGAGVVAGMYVVRVDERTLSVESGLAMDYQGREIVVAEPVIKKIFLLDGYENSLQQEQTDYLYLCIDYDEKQAGTVHNIAGDEENAQFNRICEGYHLFLTNKDPENTNISTESLYQSRCVLYHKNGIKICQVMPRYARAGEKVKLVIEVENTGKQYCSFSYELGLNCLSYEKKSVLNVSFDELLYEKTGKYTLTYDLDVLEVLETEGGVVLNEESFKLFQAKKLIDRSAVGKSSTYIVDNNISRETISHYYRSAMEEIMKINMQETIYLAKINLIHMGDACIIDKIENMPFNQYVLTNSLSGAILHLLIEEVEKLNQEIKGEEGDKNSSLKKGKNSEQGIKIAQGKITLNLGIGGKRGDRFESTEIIHGLGLGMVTLIVAEDNMDGTITYGSNEVFEKRNAPSLELAAKLNPDTGTFVIGGRLLDTTTDTEAVVHWTALKNTENIIEEQASRKILIKPNILQISTRESFYLQAECINMADKKIEWKVRGEGGTIDSNGMYTAPNTPGVYEIIVQSIAYPEIKASIFAVVRENSR